MTYTANTGSANSGVFNTRAGEQVTLTQTVSNGTDNVNTSGMALYQNSTSVLVTNLIQEVTFASTYTNPVVGDVITFYSDEAKTTQTAVGTIQAYNASNKTVTVNAISGTIATTNYANGETTSFASIQVTHTGGFRAGEVFQGTGSAKANGNITAVGSATPTYSGALSADRNGVVGGEFTIPATTYRTGEKLFRLTDSSTDTVASTESSCGKEFSRVQGMLESRSGECLLLDQWKTKRENS